MLMKYVLDSLHGNVLWVRFVDPVLTKVWNLGVKSLLEQRPVVCESCKGKSGSTSPEDKVTCVSLHGSRVDAGFGNFIGRASNVLMS